MFPEVCAVEELQVCRRFFKVLDIYTSFQPKLSKCCHEVIVDNVGDRVTLPQKVISKNKRSSPFSLSPVMLLAIDMTRFTLLVCREICLAFFIAPTDKEVWETL